MATPKAVTEILEWQQAHQGDVPYSEEAASRLYYGAAHLTSATDCSGMAIRMLKWFGGALMQKELKGATYTGNLCKLGRHVTSAHSDAATGRLMLPGDLIFFTWQGHNSEYDHVAIYAGGGRMWNHGGPGYGPLNFSLSANVYAASEVQVRRYLQPTPAPHPKPAPAPGKKLHRTWPHYMGPNDFFGLESGGNHSRGGANAYERPDILAIKHRLMALGFKGMQDNGYFGPGTKAAVAAWQRKNYAAETSDFGQFWSDDWHRLFTY